MLDELDRCLLDFERGWAAQSGPKDRMIESTLGLTAEVYYERLLMLITDSGARSYDPLTVRRLERMIDAVGRGEATG